jgi:hypothetical protein
MIGPLKTAPGGFTHVLVAIYKFTKWIEYKPITKLTPDRAVDFICNILHPFGFPNTIISDLGTYFTTHQFWDSARTQPLRLNMCQLRTQEQMVRLRGPMA